MNYKADYRVLIKGDFACFTRPEFLGERVSYDFITPSAARNILQCVYWQQGFDYVIDRIHVLNEIKTCNFRTNEIKQKTSTDLTLKAYNKKGNLPHINRSKEAVQRNAQVLKDVAYVVDFHIKRWRGWHLREDKIHGILMRNLKNEVLYETPYLGLRGFTCSVYHYAEKTDPIGYYTETSRSFGRMFLDRNYKTNESRFFMAEMVNGVINVHSGSH